jgi:hypothetical protein
VRDEVSVVLADRGLKVIDGFAIDQRKSPVAATVRTSKGATVEADSTV